MSQKSYRITTALVASLVAGLPQHSVAQDAGSAATIMLCQDKSTPPCPAGEPAEGTATPAADTMTPLDAPAAESAVPAEPVTPEPDAETAAPLTGEQTPPDSAAAPPESGEITAPADVEATPPTDGATDAPADTNTSEDGAADEATVPDQSEAPPAPSANPDTAVTSPPADAPLSEGTQPEAQAAPAAAAGADAQPTDVTEGTVSGDVRSSTEEFSTEIAGDAPAAGAAETEAAATTSTNDDDGLTNLEKALLLGLGAVAVGSLLDDGSKVVSNTGDRVVVDRNGQLVVYKDDDALLFREGTNVRTETFADGSTRTFLARTDGSQIVTIRDAEGRVLRRTKVAQDGSEVRLFDDTVQAEVIDQQRLSSYAQVESIAFSTAGEAELRTALQAETLADRTFSLRQIREFEEVRGLVPSIDLDTINFATGSAAISTGQISGLQGVGNTMEEMLRTNPSEVFLIEGHTDAVGDAASNLALSDRRAESVALALTETFQIPPENLVVQGYGAQYLKVETEAAEPANRRATVRRITPLLNTASTD